MIEVNPCYAHDSAVGPVFDVATWSRAKAWSMAAFAPVLFLLLAAALVFAWKPTLVVDKPPKPIESFHQETLKFAKRQPWVAYGVSGAVGLFAFVTLVGSVALTADAMKSDYYFRVGPGGFSLRLPDGLDWSQCGMAVKRFDWDIPADQIAEWTIVQRKQLGSMSRHAGNISADLVIRTTDGKKKRFGLDGFREPGHIIYGKIKDAVQMVPMQFAPEPDRTTAEAPAQTPAISPAENAPASRPAATIEEKCDAVLRALDALLNRSDDVASVVLSDAEGGKFVQFAGGRDSLLLDLPRQSLDEAEFARAGDYFRRLRDHLQQAGVPSAGQMVRIGRDGFQMNLSDAEQAAGLALQLFREVYRLRDDFPLVVEQV